MMCNVVYVTLAYCFFISCSITINAFTLATYHGNRAEKMKLLQMHESQDNNNGGDQEKVTTWLSSTKTRRNMILEGQKQVVAASTLLFTTSMTSIMTGFPSQAEARLDPVNKPELLPSDPDVNVIQTEKFLTSGQVKRLDKMLSNLEKDKGFRIRVLCQAYPNTPGLAIRDYWSLGKEGQKDDKYVVLVVDQFGGKGNVLNFNVGDGMKFALPNQFWTRLQSKYGTIFFVKENGIDVSITNAIEAIVTCLRSEDGYCVDVPDQGFSLKSLGM